MNQSLLDRFLFVKKISLIFFCFTCFFIPALQAQDSTVKKSVAKLTAKKTFYGQASFYANKFNGRKTANGEIFSQQKMTCACNAIKLGTWIKVTNLRNGKSVIVKVNDRLHPSMKRLVDLTRAAAGKLGYVSSGLTRVRVDVLGKTKPGN
jgi:rare lipoprotein A